MRALKYIFDKRHRKFVSWRIALLGILLPNLLYIVSSLFYAPMIAKLRSVNVKLLTACFCITLGAIHLALELSSISVLWLLAAPLLATVIYSRLKNQVVIEGSTFNSLYLALPFFLISIASYYLVTIGEMDISAIMFHLQFGIGSTFSSLATEYLFSFSSFLLGIIFFCFGNAFLSKRYKSYREFSFFAALAFYVYLFGWIAYETTSSSGPKIDLASEYSKPIVQSDTHFAGKSFVHVFLESAERTYMNSDVFGDVMAPLLPFISRGFEATNVAQIQDTGWSAAGMTAANCGVPLSPVGIFSHNSFFLAKNFIPSAICLGDLPELANHDLTYLVGADAAFAGIDRLYRTHGYDDIVDLERFTNKYEGSESFLESSQTWGVSDDLVFDEALELLKRKASSDKPFGLTIETIGGHSPNGVLSPKCKTEQSIMELPVDVLRAVKCTNWLLAQFLTSSEALGLLKDTVVIVQSDHLSMTNKVYAELKEHERRNLFFIYGDNIQVDKTAKLASPMDVYPTLLEAIGFNLPSSRAGLGVSLFSQEPTLTGTYGIEGISNSIRFDHQFRKMLWSKPTE